MATRGPLDATAFSEFVAARCGSLFRTAYLVLGDYQLAQDLMQESLIKVYVAWPRLRDVTEAEAYTRRIIVTRSISWRVAAAGSTNGRPRCCRTQATRSDRDSGGPGGAVD